MLSCCCHAILQAHAQQGICLDVTAFLQPGLCWRCCKSLPLLPAVNLTVMGVQYALFSRMSHGFGLNDAFDRSVGILQRRQQPTANASDAVLAHQDMTAQHSTVPTGPKPLPRQQAGQHEQLSLTKAPTHLHADMVPDTALSDSTSGGAVTTHSAGRQPRGAAGAREATSGGQGVSLMSDDGGQGEQRPQGHQLAEGADADAVAGDTARSGRSALLLSRQGGRQQHRRLAEAAAAAAAVEHPCLHAGYNRTYSRAGTAPPHSVTLTGRQGCSSGLHWTSLHGGLSGHAACSHLCCGSPGMPLLRFSLEAQS